MTAAVLFQNMPPLSPEEYAALESSIREHGIQVPVQVDEHGVVIDGHHRTKIADELGIDCPKAVVRGKTDAEKRTLALSLNLDRRHLSRDQRRALIAESIKADPHLPDYQHAKRTGASDKTVTSVRRDLEAHSEIPNDVPRINARGQERPASYRPRDLPPFNPATGEVIESPSVEGAATPDDAEVEAPDVEVEPEGTPSRPAVKPPRRRPITDQARDAGYELRKAIEKVERIVENDRFSANKKEVTAHLRGHLLYAVEVFQDLLDQHVTHEGA